MRAACTAEGGVEVDNQGDAFFFAFRSAPAALAAAQAVTGALAAGRIQVRIGLHTGTPLVTEEGYVGDDVHLAARVGASGHGGQVVLSRTTRELVDGLPLTDLGEHRLKDIPEAVSIFQLGSERFPPLKTISNTNLPRPASSFIGRERELRELLATIRSARLVTVTGPGGSGKTRLALEAAATLVPSYKAGVFWVGLATLRDPALVSETIAQTLGAKNGLAEHIGERELLLLLDNLEQVIEAAPQLSALLSACANLNVLVTSRELLRVQGEVEYAAPPLASPEAVALFCERSRLEPSEEIAELCVRLDELPLAVELAAARAKALSPRQILERLSQRLDLLEGGRDADPRQQTLRATIDWSHDLLSEEEQRVLRALSVFAGAAPWRPPRRSAAPTSTRCSRWSRRACSASRAERYWMLETIRDYARERLDEAGETDALARRHADYHLALLEERPTLSSWAPAVESCWRGSGKRRTTSGQPSTTRGRCTAGRSACGGSAHAVLAAARPGRRGAGTLASAPRPDRFRRGHARDAARSTSPTPSCAWDSSTAPSLMHRRLSRSPRSRGSAERSPAPSGTSPRSPPAGATTTKRSVSSPACSRRRPTTSG